MGAWRGGIDFLNGCRVTWSRVKSGNRVPLAGINQLGNTLQFLRPGTGMGIDCRRSLTTKFFCQITVSGIVGIKGQAAMDKPAARFYFVWLYIAVAQITQNVWIVRVNLPGPGQGGDGRFKLPFLNVQCSKVVQGISMQRVPQQCLLKHFQGADVLFLQSIWNSKIVPGLLILVWDQSPW